MNLSFAQKLLIAIGSLIVLIMGALTISNDIRLRSTTDRYVSALMSDAVAQSTSSIADWLNTRLDMAEATAKALERTRNDDNARVLMEAMTEGGNIKDVYAGTEVEASFFGLLCIPPPPSLRSCHHEGQARC